MPCQKGRSADKIFLRAKAGRCLSPYIVSGPVSKQHTARAVSRHSVLRNGTQTPGIGPHRKRILSSHIMAGLSDQERSSTLYEDHNELQPPATP